MNNGEEKRIAEAMERIGRVLGALYASHLGDLDQGIKAERLSRCGFSNIEIADLLGTTSNAVNVTLHRIRRGKKASKTTRRRKKTRR